MLEMEGPSIVLMIHLACKHAAVTFRERWKYVSQTQLRELCLHTLRHLSIWHVDNRLLRAAIPQVRSIKDPYIYELLNRPLSDVVQIFF